MWPIPPMLTMSQAISTASSKFLARNIPSVGESFSCANSSSAESYQTFTDEDLGGGRHGHTGHGGDLGGRLADDVGVQGAVDQQHFTHLVRFVLERIAGVGRETLLDLVVDGVDHDDSLLGGTDHAVVEGLGHQDGGDGTLHVGGFVDDDGHVAAPTPMAGLPESRRPSPCRATGGQDQVDVVVTHQGVGEFDGGLINPADDVFRRTGSHGCIQYHLAAVLVEFLARGAGEDDGVAGLQEMRALKIAVEVGLVVGTIPQMMPTGSAMVMVPISSSSLRMPQVFSSLLGVVDVFGGEVVLDNLVFDDTHTGFSHGHLGQGIRALLAARAAARKTLSTCSCEAGELTLCFFDAGNQCIQFSQIGYCHVYLLMI